jgi:hypothetical protein
LNVDVIVLSVQLELGSYGGLYPFLLTLSMRKRAFINVDILALAAEVIALRSAYTLCLSLTNYLNLLYDVKCGLKGCLPGIYWRG